MPDILLIDDEHQIRQTLSAALSRRGYRVESVANIASADKKQFDRFDLVLLDVQLPDGNGIDLLEKIVKAESPPPVIMISGHSGIDTAVRAIQLGAADFLEKPLSLDRVLITIENALKVRDLRNENRELSQMVFGRLIGNSKAIGKIIKDIKTTAPRSDRFLILGENGTGKELVARMIHENGQYRSGRFVPVNCAALPSELIESELFGHIKGSFTGATGDKSGRFAEADKGTIFLDEIGDMQGSAQAKILRVLEDGELRPIGSDKTTHVRLNVVAATNRDIGRLVDEGTFRQDLFYRLNVVTINIPPLRDRRDDIPLLYNHFLSLFASRSGRPAIELLPDAMDQLISYHYPGNIRELKNIAERITIYNEKSRVSKKDIMPLLYSVSQLPQKPLKDAVDDFEIDYIQRVIEICGNNMAEAARRLGLERSHLYKKMKKLEGE